MRRGSRFFRPICFQPGQLDFQNAVIETRLHLVGVNTEGQLHGARE